MYVAKFCGKHVTYLHQKDLKIQVMMGSTLQEEEKEHLYVNNNDMIRKRYKRDFIKLQSRNMILPSLKIEH